MMQQTQQYKQTITKGVNVKNWLFSAFTSERYSCEKEADTMDLNVCRHYATMEEIGKISYAVRRAYNREIVAKLEGIQYNPAEMNNIYFPIESQAVELSTFSHVPVVLATQVKTYVHTEEATQATFLLRNTSYMKLWVNGKEVGTYHPKTRNTENQTEIILPLQAGDNEVMIHMEELAERDIIFYFELTYLGEEALTSIIPTTGSQEQIDYHTTVLKSLYLEKDMVIGKVRVYYDPTLLTGLTKIYRRLNGSPLEMALFAKEGEEAKIEEVILTPDKDYFEIELAEVGIHPCVFTAKCGNLEMTVNLLVSVFAEKYRDMKPATTIAERKRQALELIAHSHKDFASTILAIVEVEGKLTEEAEVFLMNALDTIDAKKDCADFRLLSVMILYRDYGHLLTDTIKARIKTTILNFRYWFDEPGNDVMWFFSENHAMLFNATQYIAGEFFPDEIFTVSGSTGVEQKEKGYQRLKEWFGIFFDKGYDEWNSVTYLPVDLIGFTCLYILADGEIKEWAKQAMDVTFEIIASNMFHNRYTSAYARVYEGYMKGTELNELNMVSCIAFGQGNFNPSYQCTPMLCLSDYEPDDYKHLVNPAPNGSITVQRKQGLHDAHTYIHKTKEYSLASAVNYSAFGAGIQQNVINMAVGEKGAILWINHPGEEQFSGQRRPSYWAGNGTLPYVLQHRNTLIGVYNIAPTHAVDFIHIALPKAELDEIVKRDKWLFVKQGKGYAAIWFSNDCTITTSGAVAYKEAIARGKNQAVVVKCSGESQYGTFENFMAAYEKAEVSYDGQRTVNFVDEQYGKFEINSTDEYLLDGEVKTTEMEERLKIDISSKQ